MTASGSFAAYDGTVYSVTIENDNTGASVALTFDADPIHLSWSAPEHIYVPLRSIQCNIRVLTCEDLSGLYAAGPISTRVTVKRGTSTIFVGYLTPQTWDAPSTGNWDNVELIAVDAITALKSVPYTMVGTTPRALSADDILTRACDMVGLYIDARDLPSWEDKIYNECSFLPEHSDVAVHSSDRKTWTDVIEAIALHQRVTMVAMGNNLLYEDMDDMIAHPVSQSLELMGTDLRFSIDPARSHICVEYDDDTEMDLGFTITEDRLGKTVVQKTTVQASSGDSESERTETEYVEAKDWMPTDGREVCGAKISGWSGSLNSKAKYEYAVVGPCRLKPAAQKILQAINIDDTVRYIEVSYKGWYSSSMNKSGNYHQLPIFSRKGTGNVNISMYILPPTGAGNFYVEYSDGTHITGMPSPPSGYGMQEQTLDPHWYSVYISVSDIARHGFPLDIVVPNGMVLSSISIKPVPWVAIGGQLKSLILEKPEDYSIHDDYNEAIDVKVPLRPNYEQYALHDVATLGTIDKFPYINPEQYSVPRARRKMEVRAWNSLSPLKTIAYSGRSYVVEAADIDLRRNIANLSILETYHTL